VLSCFQASQCVSLLLSTIVTMAAYRVLRGPAIRLTLPATEAVQNCELASCNILATTKNTTKTAAEIPKRPHAKAR
jgi:multisubunit Na+/H+ antiporter MnhF subunit